MQEDGIKSIQIKEEHMEDGQWDSGPSKAHALFKIRK